MDYRMSLRITQHLVKYLDHTIQNMNTKLWLVIPYMDHKISFVHTIYT